jgi:hypothetical protein
MIIVLETGHTIYLSHSYSTRLKKAKSAFYSKPITIVAIQMHSVSYNYALQPRYHLLTPSRPHYAPNLSEPNTFPTNTF